MSHEVQTGNLRITAPGLIGARGKSSIIYDVVIVPVSTANNATITFYENTKANATGTTLKCVLCSLEKEHSTVQTIHEGLLLKDGGYVTTSANLSYALITYRMSSY